MCNKNKSGHKIKSGHELGDKINQVIKSGNKINQAIKSSISVKVGREALVTARKFLEQREFTTESDVRYIRNIIKRLDEAVEMSKRQTSLMEFINQ